MDEKQQELVKRLAGATPRSEIKKDPNGLDYVTARYVMNTLDSVVGPGNWSDSYQVMRVMDRNDGTEKWVVECTITVFGVSKTDVGIGESRLSQKGKLFGEPEKTAYSNALKRAGVKWGIARDLYGDGLPESEQDSPVEQPAPAKKQAAKKEGGHWAAGDLKVFWAYVKGTLGLTEDEVHEALEVASVRDFAGTKADAMRLLNAYATAKADAQGGAEIDQYLDRSIA